MSVVNQMLRDLDRRRGDDGNVYGQHLQPVSGGNAWRKALIVIGLLILIALIALIYTLMPRPQQATAVIASPAPQKIAPPPVAVSVAPPVAIVAPVVVEPEPAPKTIEPTPTVIAKAPEKMTLPPPVKIVAPAAAPVPAPEPEPVIAPPPEKAKAAPGWPATHGPVKIDVRPSATAARTAESEFKRAVVLINQARAVDARAALAEALKLDASHEGARQTLAVMQVEAGMNDEAEATLNEGLRLNPTQANLALLLARLKVDRGDVAGGLAVLREHGAAATNNAQYRSFTGALSQRVGRYNEAIEEYKAALTLAPNTSLWWVGLGLSFEGAGQTREAADAFTRARIIGALPPEINEFVERKLQTLR